MSLLESKAFRISALIALLLALYALAGFVLAPKLIRNALLEDLPKTLALKPAVGDIRVNPFLFQVEIKNFSLTDSGGEKLLGFERFFIDFELSSIWHRAYSFVNIDIGSPFVNAIVAKDGRLNLLELSPKPQAVKPVDAKAQPLPAVRIRSFKVSGGLMTYDDRSRPSTFAARLEPINFQLRDFTTGVDGGRFTFTGKSKLGERVEWHGHLSVQPIESDGEFQIDGLQAHTIWEYLEDQLNFEVNSGRIDLNATYKFALKDNVDLQVEVQKAALSDLLVRPRGGAIDWITLPSLLVSGGSLDLGLRTARVDSVKLAGLKLVAWLEPDGSFNLLRLAAPPQAAEPKAASVPPPPTVALTAAAGAGDARPWNFNLHQLLIEEASIAGEDRAAKPVVKVQLAPLFLKIENVSLDMTKPLSVSLDTKINDTGSLSVDGAVTPRPLAADVAVKLSGVELSNMQPYVAQTTSMTVLGGTLGLDGRVRYGAKKPAAEFTGDLNVANLHTVDNALHDDFINWESLQVKGIDFQHAPERLNIDEVLARKAYARVIIEPDASVNVNRVLAGPGATLVAAATPNQPPGTAPTVTATAAAPVVSPRAAARAKRAKTKAAALLAGSAPAAIRPAGMPVSIKKVVLQASEADFADLSVKPNFSTGIQNLQGTMTGLSSQPGTRAKIDLHGSIDAFSPVAATGEANFLSPVLFTDVALTFRNIELSTFNPYSGKFAGYNISKGKLTTEFRYRVDGRKLDAQHHITVDQLEFGDKTDSKEAVSLPIKLAVALMKDRNGVIDLDVPVTGSLDDPQFRLGPIIWKVFVNILERAVTAPFALLGSLFGGGPDLQFVDFQPGAADLDATATEKAQSMVKALSERPQLKIEVPIAVVNELDRPQLVEAQYQTQLLEAQAGGAGRSLLDTMTTLYQKDFGREPKFPDAINAIKKKPDQVAAKIEFLSNELHGRITVSDADLQALAQRRAANLQAALLTNTPIDAERVFLVDNDKAKNQDGKVRLELSLR